MLKELQIENFLSYEKETVKFPSNATIAVIGDNGHGKSSMLEAIRFALYGDGREDLSGMIRLGTDSGMSAKVILEVPSGEMTVERGVRPSGGGYTKVWLNDTIVAKGGAATANNKAQEFIDSVLGVDKETFSLTSFFGLGANDTLMQVRPAERLETLQKLAGIDVCMKFNKVASGNAKGLQKDIEADQVAIRVHTEKLKDVEALTTELTENLDLLEKRKQHADDLAAQRLELLRNEEKYRSMVNEKERLQERLTNATNLRNTKDQRIDTLKRQLREMKTNCEQDRKKRDKAKEALAQILQEKVIQAEIEGFTSQITELEVHISLRETAIEHPSNECPLCGSNMDEHKGDLKQIERRWAKEIEISTEACRKLKFGRKDAKELLKDRHSLEEKIERDQLRITNVTANADKMKIEGREVTKEVALLKEEISKTKDRLNTIAGVLTEYDEVVKQIAEIDEQRNKVQERVGSVTTAIGYLRQDIKESKAAQRQINKLKKSCLENKRMAKAYSVVAEAFSRYAIPVQLLRNLRTAMEKRATKIYQQFNNGQIRIDDVEGARPGVEFVLQDEMGVRAYKALSSGEKVMVFLAVRIALTQIINGGRDNRVRFLILDEIAGNLSPTKRESLTKLINVLLRKYFQQVLLVSHVALRDIFTKTFHVVKEGGVSRVT